jgi:hypothetical protein
MGDWTVLKSWNNAPGTGRSRAASFHESEYCLASQPKNPASLYAFMCYPVVEQHQSFPTGAPEFTISLKWQQGDPGEYLAGKQSYAHGWRYTARWVEGHGRKRVISGYGFLSREAAKQAVEEKVTKIVQAQRTEEVYKFRPEVP